MKCPFCGHDETQVKDSRPSEEGGAIRRRRVCSSCEARFTTFERVQLRELTVLKGDGRKEVFDREKLLRSLRLPLQKRPVEDEQIERTVNVIISNLERLGENEITSDLIGQHVMEALRGTNEIAREIAFAMPEAPMETVRLLHFLLNHSKISPCCSTSMPLMAGFSIMSCRNSICRPSPSLTFTTAERTSGMPLPPATST